MIDNLHLIVCEAEENSEFPSPDPAFQVLTNRISALSGAECHQHLLNTSAQFTALAKGRYPLSSEALQQAIAPLQADRVLDLVILFPPSNREAGAIWQKFPQQLAALSENPSHGMAGVVFRVSTLQELGFADVSAPVWDVIIRIAKRKGSIQFLSVAEELAEQTSEETPPMPDLAPDIPGRSWQWLKSHLDAVTPEDLVSNITSQPDGMALKAGLLQIHDYLDASHELSQSVQGRGRNAAGDYWHAIMHRREPDYSNAKYWFRNVGSHPVFEPLGVAVDSLLSQEDSPAAQTAHDKLRSSNRWDPFAFVDFCQECNQGADPELTRIAQQIQWAEMQLLLEQTYRDATS